MGWKRKLKGAVRTIIQIIGNPINPAGRYATPREIAELAVFMVGRTGDLIVGSSFFITGGGGTISMHR